MKLFSKSCGRANAGFTMVELLTSVAIIALLSFISFSNFWQARSKNDLTDTATQAVALLRQAQSQSMSGYEGQTWGVRFGNGAGSPSSTFFALFAKPYSTGTVVTYSALPTDVLFVTSTLAAGATTDIIFAPIIGTTMSTHITLYIGRGSSLSSTITIASSGEVSF